jgi:hypothetical protein
MNARQYYYTVILLDNDTIRNKLNGRLAGDKEAESERLGFLCFLCQAFFYFFNRKEIKEKRFHENYNHDYSDGSTPINPKAKKANSEWIRNAWKNVRNPYDFAVALTGTMIFGTMNGITALSTIPKNKYKIKTSCNRCIFTEK